jgi:homoserine kinase
VRIRVPASSANLGPGFDCLGLALGLHDVVVARVTDSGLAVDVAGEGADRVRRDRRNLVVSSMRATFDRLGGQPRGLEVVCANRIPHGRGLGSSAAAIVAGVCAARALVLGGLPDTEALDLAAALEGHPDNVAACLLGGLTAAWTGSDGVARALSLPVSEDLRPVALVPSGTMSTRRARALLPPTVPFADAAHTVGRAVAMAVAFGSRPDLLADLARDRLHEPYRLAAQPRTSALIERLHSSGIAATLSGSGPTVLGLAVGDEQASAAAASAGRGWEALPLAVDREGACALPAAAPAAG